MEIYSFEWWMLHAALPFLFCYFLASLPGFIMILMSLRRRRTRPQKDKPNGVGKTA